MGDDETSYMQTQFGGATSSSADQRVHPADALGLAEGGQEQDPQEWRRLLQNVVSLRKVRAVVGRRALPRIYQLLQEPIVIDSQEGEGSEDVPTKVSAPQILHHVLVNAPPGDDDALAIPDEHLELLQDLLERLWPPLKRKIPVPPTTPSGERSVQGEHVIKFMRRQADYDALRVAAGVVFTVAGVIKESPEFRNESLLLGEIAAGEIHNIVEGCVGQKLEWRRSRGGPGHCRQMRLRNGSCTCKKKKTRLIKRQPRWKDRTATTMED